MDTHDGTHDGHLPEPRLERTPGRRTTRSRRRYAWAWRPSRRTTSTPRELLSLGPGARTRSTATSARHRVARRSSCDRRSPSRARGGARSGALPGTPAAGESTGDRAVVAEPRALRRALDAARTRRSAPSSPAPFELTHQSLRPLLQPEDPRSVFAPEVRGRMAATSRRQVRSGLEQSRRTRPTTGAVLLVDRRRLHTCDRRPRTSASR